LKYLELRGLQLKPDLVLFYHEYNDSLQTIGRDGGPKDEAALAATDMQLYYSRRDSLHRALLSWSAIYRTITYHTARRRIEKSSTTAHPVTDQSGNRVSTRLPVRVPVHERLQVLQELRAVCEKNHVQLVVMHPSYHDSTRHECELTEFCHQQSVSLFEAYDSLHPDDTEADDLYLDGIHPNGIGHDRMARDLCAFLRDAGHVSAKR
jgi:hypothetical protein